MTREVEMRMEKATMRDAQGGREDRGGYHDGIGKEYGSRQGKGRIGDKREYRMLREGQAPSLASRYR